MQEVLFVTAHLKDNISFQPVLALLDFLSKLLFWPFVGCIRQVCQQVDRKVGRRMEEDLQQRAVSWLLPGLEPMFIGHPVELPGCPNKCLLKLIWNLEICCKTVKFRREEIFFGRTVTWETSYLSSQYCCIYIVAGMRICFLPTGLSTFRKNRKGGMSKLGSYDLIPPGKKNMYV